MFSARYHVFESDLQPHCYQQNGIRRNSEATVFLLPMQKSRNNYVTRLENFECAGMQRNNAESVLATIAKVGVVSSNLIARSKNSQ